MTYIAPPAPTFEEVQAHRRIIRNRKRGWRQGRYLSEPRAFCANLSKKYRWAYFEPLSRKERMPYSWQESMKRRSEQKTGFRRPDDPWKKINGKRIGYGPFIKRDYRPTWKLQSVNKLAEWRVWSVYQVANLGGRLCKRKFKVKSKYKVAARPGRWERALEYRRKFETGELWRGIEAKLPPGSRYYIGHPD